MADKIWPTDKLGNEIRKGDIIELKLDEPSAMFFIDDVEPATFLHGSDGPIPVNGTMTLVLQFPLQYSPQARQMFKAVVVKKPEHMNMLPTGKPV